MINVKLKPKKVEGVCPVDACIGFHKVVNTHSNSVFKIDDVVLISRCPHGREKIVAHLGRGFHYKTHNVDAEVRIKPVTVEELEVVNAD